MKGNIILYGILVFIILYIAFLGVGELKEAYTKGLKKGGGDSVEPKYTEPTYYDLNKVWSEPEKKEYIYNGVPVPNTDTCNLYTYETFYSLDKTNIDGSLNTLVDEKFAKPSLSNVFEDLVNGLCHRTEISEEQKNNGCTDVDQIYAYRASRECKEDQETLNRCLNSVGVETPQGKDDNYNVSCATSKCDGILGAISLNYFSNRVNINSKTKCISIKKIKVPPTKLETLAFYRKLNIIEKDDTVGKDGPYPIEFDFKDCNTMDPRQKLKIITYEFKLEAPEKEGEPPKRVPVYKKKGSYGSIIFRGLNSYLDIGEDEDGNKTGNFVLRPIPNSSSKITETIKWIFMPRLNLTRKTIPSMQRCVFLRSNFEIKGENPELAVGESMAGTYTHAGLDAAARSYLAYNQLGTYGRGTGSVAESVAKFYLGPKNLAPKAGLALRFLALTRANLNPILMIFSIIQLISGFVRQRSYLDPPVSSVGVPVGFRVSPTNFGNTVTDTGPRGPGQANDTLIENYCISRELEYYPPYFLESLTNNNDIFPEYINYKFERASTVVLKSLTEGVYGLYLYKSKDNLKFDTETQSVFKDRKTLWRIYEGKKRFIESLGYPKEYFTSKIGGVSREDGLNVEINQIKLGGTSSGYQKSPFGITDLEYEANSDQEIARSKYYYDNDIRPEPTRENEVDTKLSDSNVGEFKGAGCQLTIIIDTKPTIDNSSVNFLSNFYITNPGDGYSKPPNPNDGSYSIEAVSKGSLQVGEDIDFTLKFKVTGTGYIRYVFKALVKSTEGKYLLPTAGDSTNPKIDKDYGYGLVIQANYNPEETTDNCFKYVITNSGFNYKIGKSYTYYLAQYTNDGNETLIFPFPTEEGTIDTESLKLISFTVNNLNKPDYKFDQMAPVSLTEEDLNPIYNFMDNSPNNYDFSPQQIVYGGEVDSNDNLDLITKLSTSISGNLTSEKIYEFSLFLDAQQRINNNGILQPTPNSIMNLKSIQINNLKYDSNTGNNQQGIPPGSSVVLGRFIPYQKFTTSKDVRVEVGEDDVLIDKGPEFLSWEEGRTYYNWNNTQIIPYGLRDVYTNVNFIRNPPSF